jgi:hypothetical protein
MSVHTANPDITVSITITDADREVLEVLSERYWQDDTSGILEHILTMYYDRLQQQETKNENT